MIGARMAMATQNRTMPSPMTLALDSSRMASRRASPGRRTDRPAGAASTIGTGAVASRLTMSGLVAIVQTAEFTTEVTETTEMGWWKGVRPFDRSTDPVGDMALLCALCVLCGERFFPRAVSRIPNAGVEVGVDDVGRALGGDGDAGRDHGAGLDERH